jgi:ATP-dependent DNA helicase RecQ
VKKFTANYSYTNHNFVIQNLSGKRIDNEFLPAVCILKNILQRGRPTLMSKFLQKEIGSIHKSSDFYKSYPLIDNTCPRWERIIRGNVKGNYFPAKKFFEELILQYLSEYKFIQQLILPEVPINEITQVQVDEFANLQVDFYLPQAYLIIEIDGVQHERDIQQDRVRDLHTQKYGIKTVRISTHDLNTENELFKQKIAEIKNRIDKVISRQTKRTEKFSTFISLQEYKTAFETGIDLSNNIYKAATVIRYNF